MADYNRMLGNAYNRTTGISRRHPLANQMTTNVNGNQISTFRPPAGAPSQRLPPLSSFPGMGANYSSQPQAGPPVGYNDQPAQQGPGPIQLLPYRDSDYPRQDGSGGIVIQTNPPQYIKGPAAYNDINYPGQKNAGPAAHTEPYYPGQDNAGPAAHTEPYYPGQKNAGPYYPGQDDSGGIVIQTNPPQYIQRHGADDISQISTFAQTPGIAKRPGDIPTPNRPKASAGPANKDISTTSGIQHLQNEVEATRRMLNLPGAGSNYSSQPQTAPPLPYTPGFDRDKKLDLYNYPGANSTFAPPPQALDGEQQQRHQDWLQAGAGAGVDSDSYGQYVFQTDRGGNPVPHNPALLEAAAASRPQAIDSEQQQFLRTGDGNGVGSDVLGRQYFQPGPYTDAEVGQMTKDYLTNTPETADRVLSAPERVAGQRTEEPAGQAIREGLNEDAMGDAQNIYSGMSQNITPDQGIADRASAGAREMRRQDYMRGKPGFGAAAMQNAVENPTGAPVDAQGRPYGPRTTPLESGKTTEDYNKTSIYQLDDDGLEVLDADGEPILTEYGRLNQRKVAQGRRRAARKDDRIMDRQERAANRQAISPEARRRKRIQRLGARRNRAIEQEHGFNNADYIASAGMSTFRKEQEQAALDADAERKDLTPGRQRKHEMDQQTQYQQGQMDRLKEHGSQRGTWQDKNIAARQALQDSDQQGQMDRLKEHGSQRGASEARNIAAAQALQDSRNQTQIQIQQMREKGLIDAAEAEARSREADREFELKQQELQRQQAKQDRYDEPGMLADIGISSIAAEERVKGAQAEAAQARFDSMSPGDQGQDTWDSMFGEGDSTIHGAEQRFASRNGLTENSSAGDVYNAAKKSLETAKSPEARLELAKTLRNTINAYDQMSPGDWRDDTGVSIFGMGIDPTEWYNQGAALGSNPTDEQLLNWVNSMPGIPRDADIRDQGLEQFPSF